MFRDRAEAGRRLADALASLAPGPAVVAPIPRGGVAVALPIAERLRAPMAMVYARKLAAPTQPELAFGALDEDGDVIIDSATVAVLGLRPRDVDAVTRRVAEDIRQRMALYRVPPLAAVAAGRSVILVDDGLATGLTMRAAVRCARRHQARDVTVAVPCASSRAAEALGMEADRLVSLIVDPDFAAVGAYYVHFPPVTEAEMQTMIARAERVTAGDRPATVRLAFTSSVGRRLAGELLMPDGDGRPAVVVFAHDVGGSRASPTDRAMAEAIRDAGLAVLLFDFTGHGESEGTDAACTTTQQTDDLRAAIDVLATLDDVDAGRLGVVAGGSIAVAALRLAGGTDRVRALAIRAGLADRVDDVVPGVRIPTLLVPPVDPGDRTSVAAAAELVAGWLKQALIS